MNQTDLPDPVGKAIEQLTDRIRNLEAEVQTLREAITSLTVPSKRSAAAPRPGTPWSGVAAPATPAAFR